MKDRRPRKLKKQAKRKKLTHDAFVMAQAAVVTAQTFSKLAIINSTPFLSYPSKAMSVVAHTQNATKAIQLVLSQIKPWRAFA